jgi:hypothetical protein
MRFRMTLKLILDKLGYHSVRYIIHWFLGKNPWTLKISTNAIEHSAKSIGYIEFLQMLEKCIEVVGETPHYLADTDVIICVEKYSNFQNLVKALQQKHKFKSSLLDLFCSKIYNRNNGVTFELIVIILIMLTHSSLICEMFPKFIFYNLNGYLEIPTVTDPSHCELYHLFALKEVKLMDGSLNCFRCLVLDCLRNVLTNDIIMVIKQVMAKLSTEDYPCAYCSEFHPLKFCHYAHKHKCKACKEFMVVNNESDLSRNLHQGLDPGWYEDAELMCNICNTCSMCGGFIPYVNVSIVSSNAIFCSICYPFRRD